MNTPKDFRFRLKLIVLLLIAVSSAFSQLKLIPNTTLTEQTRNNTSASSTFKGLADGVPAPANTSKIGIRSLLYSGATTKIYAHYMGWFGSSDHPVNVGYSSTDTAQIHLQVNDMIYRGFSGVIASWDDHPTVQAAVPLLLNEVQLHPGFEFAFEMEMPTLDHYAKNSGCDVTTKVIDILTDAYNRFETSASYMRINGRPVVFFFGGVNYYIDWNRVRASVPGNPLLVFRNQDKFAAPYSDGAFSWITHSSNPFDEQLSYLSNFYEAGKQSGKTTLGSAWASFNDNSASWGQNRINHANCGLTWLHTLAEVGSHYNSAQQLERLRIVTWNDYEENTAIEPGIDNCLVINASVSGNTLSWTAAGAGEQTVHDYTIFVSIDGQNLMKLKSVGPTTHSLDLASFGFVPGTYIFYVKAIGHPSIQNQISNPIKYSTSNKTPTAVLTLSTSSGVAPLSVTADLRGSSDPDGFIASAKIDFGDGTVVSGLTATHVYQKTGPYTIIGTVEDNSSLFSRNLKNIRVNPATPAVVISSPMPGATVAAPVRVVSSANIPEKIKTFNLKVDGTTTPYTTFSEKMDRLISMYNGPHTLLAEATDINGNVYSVSVNVNVDTPGSPPVASLQVSGLPSANTVLACTASSSDPEGKLNKTEIRFGDGTAVASGPSAVHTYSAAGSYVVKATVFDATGRTNTTSKTITVGSGSGSILGKVTDISTKLPLANSTVTYSTFSTLTDSAGNYRFAPTASGATYTVTAKHSGYLARSSTVTVGSADTLANFELATAGKIAGVVKTASGTPVPGVTITIKGGVIPTTVTKTTDSTGHYATTWIPIGNYTVTAVKTGYSNKSATKPVTTGQTSIVDFVE
jgi:PKD repeat protein